MDTSRFVIRDHQWAKMEPHCLGEASDPSRSGTNNRLFVEAVLWKARTGSPWRDLPEGLPGGRIEASDKGTLVSVNRKRYAIHRSEDGGKSWQEVYTFTPDPDATGGAQGFADVAYGKVRQTP